MMGMDEVGVVRRDEDGAGAGEVSELELQLQESRSNEAKLKRRLAEAQRSARVLAAEKEQILRSTSWRVTAPLRKVRTLLGAPAPLAPSDASLTLPPVEAAGGSWGTCLPSEIPLEMAVASTQEAMRSNESCVMLRPEALMVDALPPDILPGIVQRASGPALSFATGGVPGRIAFIGSASLAAELAFDVEVVRLDQEAWLDQIGAGPFAFLLIEPVWSVENRAWRNVCSSPENGRRILGPLADACRARGIPVVLWYRNVVDELEYFGWMVELADRIYTVDEGLAQALGQAGARDVGVLEPAIQPALHNPFRRWGQLNAPGWNDRVLYDGWLDLAEGVARDPLIGHYKADRLLVSESRWDFGGVRLADQPDFVDNAVGCLSAPGKVALSKMVGAEIFARSPLTPDWLRQTMMMRSLACGALTASTAPGVPRWAGLPLTGEPGTVAAGLDALLSEPVRKGREHHQALRSLVRGHCLSDRLDRIASDLQLPVRFGRRPARVACLLVTMRHDLLPQCLDRFRADEYPHKELVVVLHGWDAPLAEARKLVREGEPITVHRLGREHSLGACLNFAAAHTDADYWAKIDDDDIYGREYLSDVMLWRKFVDFDVGGKTAAFTYAEGTDQILFDPALAQRRSWQHRVAGKGEKVHIAGGTLVGKRHVLAEVPFSDVRRKGSDTNFLRRADAAGFDLHSFDYFNFALFRSGQEGFHTWNVDHEQLQRRTTVAGRRQDLSSVVFL
jgi:hypothetical protein